jgi:uncharacterized protein (TIGR03089 family)
MTRLSGLDGLLSAIPDPSKPLLTYYDESTGERVELSTITTANWVAKTSNFLVDDLEAEPGTRIRIGLPTHWLRFVWILSAWNVGAIVADTDADIGVSGPELEADEDVRVAASLRPLGGRFTTAPPGFLDIAAEVPGHGDHFVALDPPQSATIALDVDGRRFTHAELLAESEAESGRRLFTPGSLARDAGVIVQTCLGGGSLVIVSSATPEQISRVSAQEVAEIQ